MNITKIKTMLMVFLTVIILISLFSFIHHEGYIDKASSLPTIHCNKADDDSMKNYLVSHEELTPMFNKNTVLLVLQKESLLSPMKIDQANADEEWLEISQRLLN